MPRGKTIISAVPVFLSVLFILQITVFFHETHHIDQKNNYYNSQNYTYYGYDFRFQYDTDTIRDKFPLPKWMDDFLFNQTTFSIKNEKTVSSYLSDPNEKFIVLTCHKYKGYIEEKCGGITDRLRMIPYYIWLAYKHNRKLLIKHSHPFPLEEFFVPPPFSGASFDWRVPTHFIQDEWSQYAERSFEDFKKQRRLLWHEIIDKEPYKSQRFLFINNNLAWRQIQGVFESNTGLTLDQVWPGIFRRMFVPSTNLAKVIDQHVYTINKNDAPSNFLFTPGNYASAHVRAKYPKIKGNVMKFIGGGEINMTDTITRQFVHDLGDNSIQCALKGMSDAQHVYFASDTYEIAKYLVHESPHNWSSYHPHDNKNKNDFLVMRPNMTKQESLHSGFEGKTSTMKPNDYFPTYIDLWMMAHSKCISHGIGGFGVFASMISGYFKECRVVHRTTTSRGILKNCPLA